MVRRNRYITILAVDLGAESGRVMAVHFDGKALRTEELHRFPNGPVTIRGTFYWDFLRLWSEIQVGIEKGIALQPASLGVDTWGVDFALLDHQGNLIGNPVHYRDERTDKMMELAFSRVTPSEIFAITGIQFIRLNTLYQMLSLVEAGSPQLQIAHTFLTVPDLINYWLTGAKVCEYTEATTTQMLDARTGGWATGLQERLGLPTSIFPEIVPPGTRLGEYRGIPVIAPATHDTGSAVAGVPALEANFGYISSGTWSLVGLEVPKPILSEAARKANVTNEGGVYGTVRLLKNVMGLWIVQQCRAYWAAQGEAYSYSELVTMAAQEKSTGGWIEPDNPLFFSPGDHPNRVQSWNLEHNQPIPQSKGAILRCVLESLAFTYRKVLDAEKQLAGRSIETIHIVGGGSQNALLNQLTADATGRPVLAGPVEATVLGNALVQLITLGEIRDLSEGRQIIASGCSIQQYGPHPGSQWEERYQQFLNK